MCVCINGSLDISQVNHLMGRLKKTNWCIHGVRLCEFKFKVNGARQSPIETVVFIHMSSCVLRRAKGGGVTYYFLTHFPPSHSISRS